MNNNNQAEAKPNPYKCWLCGAFLDDVTKKCPACDKPTKQKKDPK
jgi:rubrerythrin